MPGLPRTVTMRMGKEQTMRLVRVIGVALGTFAVLALAAGTAYTVHLVRLWGRAVRATDPFDPAEPI